jgi:NAD-dependent deacetylase
VSGDVDTPRDSSAPTGLPAAARALAGSRLVVVFTGSGVSKESGIPTFRDPETGLWAKYDPMGLATLEAYERDPAFVWSWYEHRFGVVAEARPNAGHVAIAELGRLLAEVVVVTQNVDGLHQRAGSADVVELHGTMHSFRCLGGGHAGYRLADVAGQTGKPPRCPACGGLLRPEVVWFGEALPEDALERAQRLGARCDVMLVVGTSGVVYPAAALPQLARSAGAAVVEVNPQRTDLSPVCDHHLEGPGGEVLPRLVAAVREELSPSRPA